MVSVEVDVCVFVCEGVEVNVVAASKDCCHSGIVVR